MQLDLFILESRCIIHNQIKQELIRNGKGKLILMALVHRNNRLQLKLTCSSNFYVCQLSFVLAQQFPNELPCRQKAVAVSYFAIKWIGIDG